MTHEARNLLEDSEERFRTLVANIPGTVYRCAYDGQFHQPLQRRMVFLSEAIQSISGYAPSDFINNRVRSFASIIHPQDRVRIEQAIWQSISAKQPYVVEYRIVRANGSVVWVYDKGQGIWNENEDIFWLDGVILDITEQKKTEFDLQDTQAFLNSILENLPVGVFIKDADELRIMYWNKASEELFGYSKEDILGKNDYEFLPRQQARYLRAQDRQVLAQGNLVDIPEDSAITPHRGKRFIHTKKVPLCDERGIPRYLLSICEDITERKRAEEALRESEAHYRRIVETASEGVWMFDAESKTIFANSRIAEMLGYTLEELLGKSLFDFMDEESRVQAQTYVKRRRQGMRERHDFKFCRKDGSVLWAMVSATPIFDAEEQFVGVLRMITDISDRKQAEEALRESERRFRAIFDSMFQFIGLLKPDGTLLEANQTALDFAGLRLEDIAGRPFWETRWWRLQPQIQDRLKAAIAKAAAGEFVRYEVDVLGAGDQVVTIDFSIKPVKDETGQVVLLIPEGRDISDKKQAEKALRENEQRFRATFDQAAVGIAHVDLDGKFLRINQKFCDLVGYTQEEMLGQSLQDITHPDDLEVDLADVCQVLSGEIQMYSVEKRYISRNRGIVWVNLTVSLRRRSSGEPKYFISVVQDISDRKQAEVALRRSESQLRLKNQQLQETLRQLKQTQSQLIQNEKMVSLGQMVAGIAHEINNPISFIYGNVTYADEYAQYLLNLVNLYRLHYPEPVREIQDNIEAFDLDFVAVDFSKVLCSMQEGANRIREIVLSLRNFSRLDEAEIKPANLHDGIDNTLLILQHRLKGHAGKPSIELRKEYEQLPLVECYAGSLNQVFMNLLINAIDALEPQSAPRVISICTELKAGKNPANPQSVVIRIADNGPGIPSKVKQQIFDPFFTTKPIGVGTGLGLSIAYSIVVEKHRGTLTCHSVPGKGAEFVIELPVRQPKPS